MSSPIINGGTINGVELGASLSACDGKTNSIPTPTDYRTCLPAAMAYDDVKLQALINQMDGYRSNGVTAAAVPALFGMNFEAVDAAQTLSVGGYVDPLAEPSPLLDTALAHVDAALGRIVAELGKKGLRNSTLILLTAKHGQAPIDRTLVRKFPLPRGPITLVDPLQFIQQTVPGVDSIFASFVNPNSAYATISLGGHLQLGGDVGMLWLQAADQTNYNVSTIVGALSDPDTAQLIGATTPPAGSIFPTSVTAGADLAATFGDPQSADLRASARAPNVFIQPDLGTLYIADANAIAGHGGGSLDDTNVALLLSHPAITQTSVFEPVATTQVALTILRALHLDSNQLTAVRVEKTTALPDLPF